METAGDYEAKAYWENRTDVGSEMFNNLKRELGKVNTDVSGFMLLKIDLPDTYEAAIVQTEVTKQQQQTYMITRDVNETQQVTENIKAMSLANITMINANASKIATQIVNNGNGKVAKQNIEYVTLALMNVTQELGFTASTSILDYFLYQKLSGLREDTPNKLQIGLNTTMQI